MKLTLTIESGSLSGRQYTLEQGILTVGRGEGADVRFDPTEERIASKRHCHVESGPDGFMLVDDQSTNGTLLNGEVIDRAKLSPGDRIQFGRSGIVAVVNIEMAPSEIGAGTILHMASSSPTHPQLNLSDIPNQDGQPSQQMGFRNSLTGLGGPGDFTAEPESEKSGGAMIGFGIGILAVLVMALIVFVILSASIGLIPAIIASVIAFPPAALYILPILGLDRYDPEPAWLLGFAFSWGGLVAVFVSFILNTLVGTVAGVATGNAAIAEIAGAVISAPIVEEGSKGLGVLLILIFFRKYLDDILDGVVYAAVVALGFATVENVLYYGRGLTGGLGALGFMFLMRGILSPFAHVTFTAMTGIGCGIARESYKGCIKWIFPLLGYFGAVFLHMLWNGMATFLGGYFFAGYVILEIPFFLVFCLFCIVVMVRQSSTIREKLTLQIAQGIVTEDEVRLVTSPFRSTIWKYRGLLSGKGFARHRFIRAVGKLGLSQWHIEQAAAAGAFTQSLAQNPILRAQVVKLRSQI